MVGLLQTVQLIAVDIASHEDVSIVSVDLLADAAAFAMPLLHEDVRHTVAVQVEEGRGVRHRHDVVLGRAHASWVIVRIDQEVVEVPVCELQASVVVSDQHFNIIVQRIKDDVSPNQH